ncbi:hypothetical protein SOVF_031590, partial [Spinacia oleracea]
CCWAFSTVASMEGLNQIKTGKLVSLSEQELVDCDTEFDEGCEGGLMDTAFDFIKSHGGLTTEANYPYKATDGKCNTKRAAVNSVSIHGHENVPANSEKALLAAVAHQPVSKDGSKYWLVKNSWGTGWGEKGFMRIKRGDGPKEGLCGIAMDASYPI